MCTESGVNILPYGNAWWLLGNGISRVVSDLAGLCPGDLTPFAISER